MRSANHFQEFVFADDSDAQFLGFLQLRRAHILASEYEAGLAADAADVLASILLDDEFVLIARVVSKDTADDD